jgi:hypothetical protein
MSAAPNQLSCYGIIAAPKQTKQHNLSNGTYSGFNEHKQSYPTKLDGLIYHRFQTMFAHVTCKTFSVPPSLPHPFITTKNHVFFPPTAIATMGPMKTQDCDAEASGGALDRKFGGSDNTPKSRMQSERVRQLQWSDAIIDPKAFLLSERFFSICIMTRFAVVREEPHSETEISLRHCRVIKYITAAVFRIAISPSSPNASLRGKKGNLELYRGSQA